MVNSKHLLLPLALLAAMPASANVNVTASGSTEIYTTSNVSGRRVLDSSFGFVRNWGANAADATFRYGTGCVEAVAPVTATCAKSFSNYGIARNFAAVNIAMTDPEANAINGLGVTATANAFWEDELVISFGNPGAAGVATFIMLTDWYASTSNASMSGVQRLSWGSAAGNGSAQRNTSGSTAPSGNAYVLTANIPFVDGLRVNLAHTYQISTSIYRFENAFGYGWNDHYSTSLWGGLVSARTASGTDITALTTITSGSGFDYLNAAPAPGVPEPHIWAQLIAGFAFLGAALRGRRREPRRA